MRIVNLIVSFMLVGMGIFCNQAFFSAMLSKDGQIADPHYLVYIYLFRLGCFVSGGVFVLIFFFSKEIAGARLFFKDRLKQAKNRTLTAGEIFPQPSGLIHYSVIVFYVLWVLFITYGFIWQKDLIASITNENGIMETATVLFCLAGAALGVWSMARSDRKYRGGILKKFWMVLSILFLIFIAMEETNWGQTYFHFKTPGVLQEANAQGEVSLHNIPIPLIIEGQFQLKEYWSDYVMVGLAGIFGIIIPFLVFAIKPISAFLWAVEFPLPSRSVQIGFIIAALIPLDPWMKGYFLRGNVASELREGTIAACLFMYMWHALYKRDCFVEKANI